MKLSEIKRKFKFSFYGVIGMWYIITVSIINTFFVNKITKKQKRRFKQMLSYGGWFNNVSKEELEKADIKKSLLNGKIIWIH